MRNYEININVDRLAHYSEVLKPHTKSETLLMLMRSFSTYVKDMYKMMIAQAIYSPRYKGEWEPVDDEKYIEYLGTTPSGNIMDLMYEALEVRQVRSNIVIRFNPRYKYPGSKLPLLTVLRAIDNGTSKFSARPLLKSIIRSINQKITSLWRGYLKRGGVA